MSEEQIYKKILVQLGDGSVWEARYETGGSLELIKMVTPPKSKSPSSDEDEENSSGLAGESENEGTGKSKSEGTGKPEEPSKPSEEEEGGKGSPDPKEGEESEATRTGDLFSGLRPADSLDEMLSKYENVGYGSSGTEEKKHPHEPKVTPPIPEYVKDNMHDNAFRARLSSVMLDNKYDRKLKGRTRGKLDMTRLYKVPTQSRSVFTQKQARQGKQYNVCLLVDESGSMSRNDRSQKAAEAAIFLAKNFEGINLNVAIIGFNANISIRKEFTGKADYNRIYNAIETQNYNTGNGSNNDYDGLRRAYKLFEKAPEGKNILIMLSDGQPASTSSVRFWDVNRKQEEPFKHDKNELEPYEKDTMSHIHHLVKANSHVTSIGIGIQGGGWQIPDHIVIQNVNDLKKQIVTILRQQIKRA